MEELYKRTKSVLRAEFKYFATTSSVINHLYFGYFMKIYDGKAQLLTLDELYIFRIRGIFHKNHR